ncbi:Do/DeqQ family serine protease [Roseovarius nanhaiticus]|uniref:Do/DeqQ family serine protease n=1 Tax=Roseovarius nanhaiticus TaxID=573024 RepID=A0A1N7FYQ1_9RHOB|nr:trypsin-like peptidase domain-containing protein [Roseovarius nanhaiticus]SEK41627.1 Do/DeqQ family serine protease [Roseovarius nanhaiticus]SIS05462.1 Do/DeqQ family serine protease [Roseovarius nanhaiticus]
MLKPLAIALIAFAVPAAAQMTVPQSSAQIQMGFVPVVKSVTPAVVNIYARRVIEGRASPFADDPFFGQLFQNFGGQRPRVENSLGSGVILGSDGIVVSNYHVVGQATDIRVVLNDRREFDATVLLADEESDLAILKLEDGADLPALALRDSDSVEVGELVLAVGNPFGVGQTVSSGIVSGLARSGTATGNARGYFIQTDAPINPGNSGGALVDVNGALIGINTSILSRSGGSNGIGFAIPAALVRQFVDQARAGETRFQRPWAGVSGQPVSYDMAEGLGLPRASGIILSDMHPASPFAAAGLRTGDVILTVDGQEVNGPAEMIYRMSVAGLGADVTLDVVQRGETRQVSVPMLRAPDEPPRATLTTGARAAVPGVTLSTVNPAVMAEYDLPLTAQGALVENPGEVGARAGLRAGDVILSINGAAVTDSATAEAALEAAERRLALDIQRGQRRLTMRFRL